MSPASENLVLEHLRAIRATQDRHSQDLLEIKGRLGILEQQYASISRRVDHIDQRLDRVERRLDLVEV
ncbi:putative nucleic acid-binding Zn-ribbon protein [Neorhizobium galegae]|uniref:hypothetical protein n=1 Tax=Neorhizobium galegae TaxID=399 RepID=UPI001AE7A7B2|nr:hypothetical protein [Neorhizobium galegae]MBP2548736.1 putative nucleic acid-binding Zn-ribbon protein [Neorhizobium galegae]